MQENEKLIETYTQKKQRGKSSDGYTVTYRYDIGQNKINRAVTGSLNALGSVNLQADQEVNLFGSEIEAGSNIVLSGRDIALQSIQTGEEIGVLWRSHGRHSHPAFRLRTQAAFLA